MYVCKYDGTLPPTPLSELCNLKCHYSGCSMVCINKCFAPWNLKKRTWTHTLSLLDQTHLFGLFGTLLHLDREPVNAALCVQAHTVCPEYHCWVLVHVCMYVCGRCGWPVRKSLALGRLASTPCTGLNSEHKGGFRNERHRWRAPFSVVAPVHSYLLNV